MPPSTTAKPRLNERIVAAVVALVETRSRNAEGREVVLDRAVHRGETVMLGAAEEARLDAANGLIPVGMSFAEFEANVAETIRQAQAGRQTVEMM